MSQRWCPGRLSKPWLSSPPHLKERRLPRRPPWCRRAAAAGPQGPVVVSPQVNADRTVTLRLLAPKATEVTVTGELLNGAQPKPMTKGDDGIWTRDARTVPPDVYTYAFNIDGVNTPDPRNPWVKLVSGTGLASQVEVPGDGLQFWDSKPVPHGLVQIMTYESKAIGATRQAYVYTPPDYTADEHAVSGALPAARRRRSRSGLVDDRPRAHHHGQPDRGEEGEADDRRDAAGARRRQPGARAQRHVAGHRSGGQRRRPAAGVARAARARRRRAGRTGRPGAAAAFAQDFVGDLMPAIEKTFRVSTRPEDRAIGGLSAGGAATINTAFSRPELFSYVVIMSAGRRPEPRGSPIRSSSATAPRPPSR